MPIEMTERLERALDAWEGFCEKEAEVYGVTEFSEFEDNLRAAYREARDAPSEEQGHTIDFQNALGEIVPVTLPECFAGTFEVRNPEALRPETPLTVERLVRVLRNSPGNGLVKSQWLADALEAEEE